MDTSLEKRELLVRRYEAWLGGRGFSVRTREAYRWNLREFFRYVKEEEKLGDIREVSHEIMLRYQGYLYGGLAKPLSLSTQAHKLQAVKSFFKFLEKEDVILLSPASRLEYPKRAETLVREVLTEEEMKKLIGSVDIDGPFGLRDRAILELLYSTGMRNSELRGLDVYDLDLERGVVRIRGGKGGVDRVVPVGEIAMSYVREYLEARRPAEAGEVALFLSLFGKRIRSREAISWVVKRAAKRSDLEKDAGPHVIRHSMATHMLRRKAPIRYIQEMLGHKDLETTQIYTRVEVSDLAKIHKATHPRP